MQHARLRPAGERVCGMPLSCHNAHQHAVPLYCRGHAYSLKPQQIMYLLPGQAYEEADLQQIHTSAISDADVALLADAWEVTTQPCHAHYTHNGAVTS